MQDRYVDKNEYFIRFRQILYSICFFVNFILELNGRKIWKDAFQMDY